MMINYNMRCIEIVITNPGNGETFKINYNMRCIEMAKATFKDIYNVR